MSRRLTAAILASALFAAPVLGQAAQNETLTFKLHPQAAEQFSKARKAERVKTARKAHKSSTASTSNTSLQIVEAVEARRAAETRCNPDMAYALNHDKKRNPKVSPSCGVYKP